MDLRPFEEVYGELPEGWLSLGEATILADYAKKTQGPIVEVGSHRGRSAVFMAKALGRQIICIDPWDDYFHSDLTGEQIYQMFLANTKELDIVPVRMKVEDWTPVPCEFVYIDGDHTYEGTKRAIEKALQCNPKYIAGHDVNDNGEGVHVKQAFLDTVGPFIDRYEKMAIFKIR